MNHSFYMQLAIDEAWNYQLLTYPNPAVGAVLIDKAGKILSIQAHKKAGAPHAEVLALQEAFALLKNEKTILSLDTSDLIHDYLISHHDNIFHECTLYVTLEPCNHQGKTPPCALLLEHLGLKQIIIGSADISAARGGAKRLEDKGTKVIHGILQTLCEELIEPFLSWNSPKGFHIYKVAQRLNGTIDGGIISCEASRTHMHRIRSLVDQLIIGGNTVRMDRPTLDSRLIHGKAPDIVIFSKKKNFDPGIPLFQIPKRKVRIVSDSQSLFDSSFSLTEGGSGTFKALNTYFDWLLIYQSASIKEGKSLDYAFDGKIMHVDSMGADKLLWIKRKVN